MKCNECNKNEATVFYREIVNGKETKYALCHECAKKKEMMSAKSLFELSDPFDTGIFDSFFAPSGYGQKRQEEKRCTLCGSTFRELKKIGRVGCTKCYEVFERELYPTVTRLHGNVKHSGRVPRTEKKESALDEAASLERQLKAAILDEKYEEAAVIRDKIRSLKNKEEEGA